MNKGIQECVRGKIACVALFAWAFPAALSAANVWLPKGGAEVDEAGGWERPRLVRAIEKIRKSTAKQPYIVTRAKLFELMMNHVRLSVNTNDLYAYWVPDCNLLHKFVIKRMREYSAGRPELERVCLTWPGMKPDITPEEAKIRSVMVCCLDREHTCPDWEWLLERGVPGIAAEARRRGKEAKTSDEKLFFSCVARCYDAFGTLLRRWADFCDKKGMAELAGVMRGLAEHEPRTLREALELSLVYDTCQYIEGESVRSQGRFDKLFLRFYRDDLAAGRLTRASAKALVRDWFLRMYCKNPSGNPGKNIALGGYDDCGEPLWNELTDIAFELHRELNNPSPKLNYNFGAKTPDDQVQRVMQCVADGYSSIVFGNCEIVMEALRRRGKSEADARDFVLNGCHQPNAAGKEIIASMSCEANLAKAVEAVFGGGRDFNGIEIGPACELPADADAFEREACRQADALIARTLEWTRRCEEQWYELNPEPFASGGYRSCLQSGRDISQGGCKYNMSGCLLEGLPTLVDSITAVRCLVDERKLVTMAELGDILRKNWEGREDLRLIAFRRAPKWGNNDDRADTVAKRLHTRFAKAVNGVKNGHGGVFQAGFWTVDHDKFMGEHLAATPDGRKSGAPIARNNSASTGCGREGATALMLSNAKLDQAECPDAHILDVILPLSLAKQTNAAVRISVLTRAYFAGGGQIVHFNCFDAALLRDAMAHPEKYPDLQVRVCGWNERWVDLPKWEQELFLETVEAMEGN